MTFDMLFVSSSHSLSESIYLLDNHCKQLTDKQRAEVKEHINPELRSVLNHLKQNNLRKY
jgi:5'-3' exoribonuclease 2